MEGIENVTTFVGKGAPRFMLVYTPEQANTSYGQLVVAAKDYKNIDQLSDQIYRYLQTNFPDSEPKTKKIRLGPGRDAKIEARFSGPNPVSLRKLSNQAQEIMHSDRGTIDIRDDWRQQVKVFRPQYSENLARFTGITKANLNGALEMAFSGKQAGLYREDIDLIPIVARTPE